MADKTLNIGNTGFTRDISGDKVVTDSGNVLFRDKEGVDGTPEDDAIMVWGDNIVVNAGEGTDTVVSTGRGAKIIDGEIVEVYGNRSSVEGGNSVIVGSNSGSIVKGRRVDAWFTKNGEIKGTDAADELNMGLGRRFGLEGGQNDDQISLEMSKDNTIYLGYQSLWNKTAKLKIELVKLEKKEAELLSKKETLSREIDRLEIVLIDPKIVEKKEKLISERDSVDEKLSEISEQRKNLVLKINREFKLGAPIDLKSDAIDDILRDIYDGDNYCEDFRGERNKIVCGKGHDTVKLFDCRNDSVISGSGSCLIEQKNSAKVWGNTFIIGTGEDSIVGLEEKDTIIIGAEWYASVASDISEEREISGDIMVYLQKPRVMTYSGEGEGAFLLLGQGIDLENGERSEIELQGKTYTISDAGISDIRIEVRSPKEMVELEDHSGYEEVGGNLLLEIRGKGDYQNFTGTVEGLGDLEREDIHYPQVSANITLTAATDRKKIISTRVGDDTITLGDGSTVTIGRWEYTESERGDVYGYITMPTEEDLEEFGDEYRDRKRYNILVDRQISGPGTIRISGSRPVLELVTNAGKISILDWDTVPRVRGKFNYSYYNRE